MMIKHIYARLMLFMKIIKDIMCVKWENICLYYKSVTHMCAKWETVRMAHIKTKPMISLSVGSGADCDGQSV